MRRTHLVRTGAIVLLSFVAVLQPLNARSETVHRSLGTEEFFIISSVDLARKQILLKRPTEVTEVIHVDAGTQYFDEYQRAITFKDLRAGDTVWIAFPPGSKEGIAARIRKGPMTLKELRRRYL